MKTFNIEKAVVNMEFIIERFKLDLKKLPIFYTITSNISKNGVNKDIQVFFIIDNRSQCLGCGRTNGFAFDVAYSIFESYKAKNNINYKALPYQKYLHHESF